MVKDLNGPMNLQFGEEGEATFLNTTGRHRRKRRRRAGVEEVETSGPMLRGSRVKEARYIPSPNTSGYWGLEASK